MKEERIGDCRLILGDCLEVMPTLGPVDAVVTDPPYGVDFASWDSEFPDKDVWNLIASRTKDGGSVLVFPGEKAAPYKIQEMTSSLDYQWVIPWYKPNAMQFGKTGYSKHSLLWWLSRGKPTVRPNMIDVIVSPMGEAEDQSIGHPSPKPVRVMVQIAQQFSNPGETILDPFMGSGTTLVACAKLGRKGIGIEIDPDYFDIACKRVEEAYRQPDLFIEPPTKPTQEALF